MHATEADTVLYIGAAEGYHINLLIQMFPDLNFDLWDARKIDVVATERVRIYSEYFTNNTARSYANDPAKILLMCDIRNLNIGKLKKHKNIEKMDQLVEDDMQMQLSWCQIIKPVQAYLKFRLAYEITETEYLTGTIFFQPYSKISTECRLLTNDYTQMRTYTNEIFETNMAYLNGKIRCQPYKSTKWADIIAKYKLRSTWDNVYALKITKTFLKRTGLMTREATGKLFMEIIEFHLKKYPGKRNVIFLPQ